MGDPEGGHVLLGDVETQDKEKLNVSHAQTTENKAKTECKIAEMLLRLSTGAEVKENELKIEVGIVIMYERRLEFIEIKIEELAKTQGRLQGKQLMDSANEKVRKTQRETMKSLYEVDLTAADRQLMQVEAEQERKEALEEEAAEEER